MEEEKGISLYDIFKTILSRKWLALIVACAVAIAGVLGLYLGYNGAKTDYLCTFSLNFTGSDEPSPVYPDGTPFNYRGLISRTELEAVKNSDPDFGDLDVDGLYSGNNISITRTQLSDTEITYTLRVRANYFNSAQTAEKFMDAIAHIPARYIEGLAVNQDIYLSNFDLTEFYEDKLAALSRQREYLSQEVEKIASRTVGAFKNSCVGLAAELEIFGRSLNTATNDIRKNNYVHNVEEVRADYSAQIQILERQKAALMREYELLVGSLQGGESSPNLVVPSERITELSKQISEIEDKVSLYKGYVGEDNAGGGLQFNAEAGQNLVTLKERLASYTQRYGELLLQEYQNTSVVAYVTVLTTDGDLNLITCLAISVVCGLILGAVTAFIAGRCAQRKKSGGQE